MKLMGQGSSKKQSFGSLARDTFFVKGYKKLCSLFSSQKKVVRVGVIVSGFDTPWDGAAAQEVNRLLSEQLISPNNIHVETEIIDCKSDARLTNRLVMREVEARRDEFDIFVTIGFMATEALFQRQKTWNAKVVQIFAGVEDPVAAGFVKSLRIPGDSITGVRTVAPSFDDTVAFVAQLRPSIERVVVLYDGAEIMSDECIERDNARTQLVALAQMRGWQVQEIGITKTTDLSRVLQPHVSKIDVVFMLNTTAVMCRGEELGDLCRRTQTTLIACNEKSVNRFACIATGSRGNEYASHVVDYIRRILFDGVHPKTLEVVSKPESGGVWFNELITEEQGIRPTSEQWLLMNSRSTFMRD